MWFRKFARGKPPSDAIDALQEHIDSLWMRTELEQPLNRLTRRPRGDGTVYVEFRNDAYALICEERGEEYWRRAGVTLDDAAFYFLFQGAQQVAGRQELEERQNGPLGNRGYSRWNWMCREIALMTAIKPEYGTRATAHVAKILERAPLDDDEKRYARFPITLP